MSKIGASRGLPRLAMHGWVLGLALLAAALAPLGLQQPAVEAVATVSRGAASPEAPPARLAWREPSMALLIRQGVAAGADVASPQDAIGTPTATRHHLVRFIWPTRGAITTYFLPYHPGIDIAAVEGTPEVAADAGRVVFSGWGAYGLYVEIDHGNGFHTIYGHMSRTLVQVGDAVSPGDSVGLMGSTGRSTGPHLHFEVRFQGAPQNPLDFLP